MKKTQAKVKVGVVKRWKKTEKTQTPAELTQQRPDLEKRLNFK